MSQGLGDVPTFAALLPQMRDSYFWLAARLPSDAHAAVCSALQQNMRVAGSVLKLVKALWVVNDRNQLKTA